MNKLNREKFSKLEEGVLYFYGLVFFINYDLSKMLLIPMILVLGLRKVIYKERLNCGNNKLKKFLLLFIIGGCIWSFMAKFNYRDTRAFLKISREMILPFYIYPILDRDRSVLRKMLYIMVSSFLVMAGKTFHYAIFINPKGNAFGFENFYITRMMGMTMTTFSLGWLLIKKNTKKETLIAVLMFLIGFGVIIVSKSRAGLVAVAGAMVMTFIVSKVDLKKVLLIGLACVGLLLMSPETAKNRFETTFDTEMTVVNQSNYLRIEMWKNALWRIKQHPIRGGGIRSDQELFKEYANNMPESTEMERFFKEKIVNGGFNDAHNMYLNIITANGIFSITHFILMFGIIPTLLIRNLKDDRLTTFERSMNLGIGATFISFYIYGLFWSIWGGNWSRMEFWFLVALLCSISFGREKIIKGK